MPYKVLDIFKDLPGTNCGDCGQGSCFPFATKVYLEGEPIGNCPHLDPDKVAEMEDKLKKGNVEGGGKKEPSQAQALEFLKGKMAEADFGEMAANSRCEYVAGPPEALRLDMFNRQMEVRADDVVALDGPAPSIWVKVFLYIYVTRANGKGLENRWVAYRELPNTVSKSKTFEECGDQVAAHFVGNIEGLTKAARRLGGVEEQFGSADLVMRFQALPMVVLLMLYWEGSDEFEARATFLVDGGVLDYLDQEALVFLAEVLVKMLKGERTDEIIP